MLWMLSLVMFLGSCVAGSLPLVINLSEVRLFLIINGEYFMFIKHTMSLNMLCNYTQYVLSLG